MRNTGRYIWLGLLLFAAVACKKEDGITPEAAMPNLFYPDAAATDEYARLCRDFYAETGCYLLFNDTLKHEYTGNDRYGNPLYSTELLDLTYGVTSSVQWKFNFNYSTDYQRALQAVEILKNDILPAMDKRYHPYSFLLVNNFITYDYKIEEGELYGRWYGPSTSETYYIGSRATLVAIESLLKDKETLKTKLLRNLLEKQLTTSVLNDFYAPGETYYGREWMGDFTDSDDFITRTGILAFEETQGVGDDFLTFWVQSKTADLKIYLDDLLLGKEEEFMGEYAKYPIVLEKFGLLKEIVLDLGFNIN